MNGGIHLHCFPSNHSVLLLYCAYFIITKLYLRNLYEVYTNTNARRVAFPLPVLIPWNDGPAAHQLEDVFSDFCPKLLFKTENLQIVPLSWGTELAFILKKKKTFASQKGKEKRGTKH